MSLAKSDNSSVIFTFLGVTLITVSRFGDHIRVETSALKSRQREGSGIIGGGDA
jgi:hypothetical protein